MTAPFPPKNFIPTDSAVEGIEVYMPAPQTEAHRPVVEFNCPQCGAATAYSAAGGGLTCTHCGYFEPARQQIAGKGAQEFEFTVETMQRAAHGWGQTRKELQCQNCGAYTSVPPASLTHTCPFCASNKVIQRQAPQDTLRPRFLIPFKLEADACPAIARTWLGSSWMVSKSVQAVAASQNFTGLYLPYWTFDARNNAAWKAEVGHRKTYRSGGKTRTRIVWRWESGQATRYVDDMLVPGSSRLSERLLGKIGNFNLEQLAPYEPEYLAGFHAQAYDIPLETAWDTARHRMREATRLACRRSASGSRIRNFSMTLDFSDETWRYILLPVYLAAYTYHGKPYQIMINGQNGAISGQRPADWRKIWLVIAALFAPGLVAGGTGVALSMAGRSGSGVTLLGFALCALAAIAAAVIVLTALKLDNV